MSHGHKQTALAIVACFVTLAACSNRMRDTTSRTNANRSGPVGFTLTLAGAAPVSAASYTIAGRELEPIHGMIQISPAGTPSSLSIGSLPADRGYTLTLSAQGSDGSPCSGSALFDVAAGRALDLTVPLYCRTAIAAK